MKVLMTYRLAMAAGRDTANRQMRKEGRTKWNDSDWNVSMETFNRLYPIEAV